MASNGGNVEITQWLLVAGVHKDQANEKLCSVQRGRGGGGGGAGGFFHFFDTPNPKLSTGSRP